MAYDLSNYLSECALDNAHSKPPGVKLYLANLPSDEERLRLLNVYLRLYFD